MAIKKGKGVKMKKYLDFKIREKRKPAKKKVEDGIYFLTNKIVEG